MKILQCGNPTINRFVKTCVIRNVSGLSYFHEADTNPLKYQTIGQQLQLAAEKFPNTTAVCSHYEKTSATYPEILHKADRLAAGLLNLGMKKGDFIGIWMPNKLNWCVSTMAIARLGAICVALNPAYQTPEAEYCLKKVGMKAIFITESYKSQNYHKMLTEIFPEMLSNGRKLENPKYKLERVIIDSDKRLSGTLNLDEICNVSDAAVTEIKKLQSQISPESCFNIQFTSGTTGKPKTPMLSHCGLLNNSYQTGSRLEFDKEHHKICLNVPLFHGFGLVLGLLSALQFGASVYLPSAGFRSVDSIKCIKEHACTYVYGTPTMYVDMVSELKISPEKLESLRFAVTGGASVSPQLLLDIRKHLGVEKVRSVFGMTESKISFSSLPDESNDRILESVGKLSTHMEAKVVDKNGKTVPFGVPGELCIRGYGNMLGYFEDKEKTDELIGPDNWLKTGDQFVLHEDGYGQIVGRIKEMINRGGENIFPKEIEDLLNTHPDILESFVIGVPDHRMGEEVAAFIKLVPGKTILTQEEIKTFCKGKIAHFKVPKYVQIMDDFPKTTSGKIQKFKLGEAFNAFHKLLK